MPDKKPRVFMENLCVKCVSLVDRAANRREFLVRKNADGSDILTLTVPVMKRADIISDSTRFVTGIVYEPGVVDTHGHQMEAVEIQKSAHAYMRDYQDIDIQHNGKKAEGCWIAESAVAKAAFAMGDQQVPEGAWYMTLGIDNPEIAARIDAGELNGLSLEGVATMVAKAESGFPPKEEGPEKKPQESQPPQNNEDGETRTLMQRIAAWLEALGQRLGISGQKQPPMPQPGLPQQQMMVPQMQMMQPGLQVRKSEDTGSQTQEVQKTMTRDEFQAVTNGMWDQLVANGIGVNTSQPQEVQQIVQKSEGFTKDDLKAMLKEIADERAAEKEAQTKPAEEVKNSQEPESAAITFDDLQSLIKDAVASEVEPIRETVRKAYGQPTNANGTQVKKSESEPEAHYMDGLFSL